MNPLSSFLKDYSASGFSRLHTPGHKGTCDFINSISPNFDITEIKGSDCLYRSDGVISGLEDKISCLFGAQSVLSASGSTLCMQTMLSLVKTRQVVAMRGSHISFYNTCALLDILPTWIECSYSDLASSIPSADEVESALLKVDKPAAVYITSPNYYGVLADISGISKVCQRRGALLIVDNAHGSHLKFVEPDLHPIALEADMCCDSFHKTLPALTGAAVLHTKPGLFEKSQVKQAMSLFGSTSPSYLIMHSIGLCTDWLEADGCSSFSKLGAKKDSLIERTGVKALSSDPSKITIDCAYVGGSGAKVAELLREHKIEPEYFDERYVVLMLSPFLSETDWSRLYECLSKLPQTDTEPEYSKLKAVTPKRAMSLREAYFSETEKVPSSQALGRVCARCEWACPPGVPVVVAGELIDKQTIDLLIKNNHDFIYAVK